MSQSTSPLSFFTYCTLLFPYLKQGSTYLYTCIVEKSILEFGYQCCANCQLHKQGKKKPKPGLHRDDGAAKTPFRICISNYNHCCVSNRYLTSILYGTGANINIFSTDRTPLIFPNFHIKLYREGKQMPS